MGVAEDDGAAGRDLGRRDADRVDLAAADVAADAAPRDRLQDEALEGLGVEQTVEPVGALPVAKKLGHSFHTEHALRQPQEIPGREAKDLVDLQVLPDSSEAAAAGFRLVGGRRQEAGVDCAHRRPADDVEIGLDTGSPRQNVEDEAQDSGFVGASSSSP